ncbi:hypothetical protein ACVW0P_003842 [Mucilaginibacter sp. UYNi724]
MNGFELISSLLVMGLLYESSVDVRFFFVAKNKRTKEKTRGLTVLLFKGVGGQCLCYPRHANAALGVDPLGSSDRRKNATPIPPTGPPVFCPISGEAVLTDGERKAW